MNWMMKMWYIKISFGLLTIALILSSCDPAPSRAHTDPTVSGDEAFLTLPFYKEASFTPHWIDPNSEALDTFHRIASFSLTDQEGDTINNETFEDKIYVADFFFTICPGICPKMTDNMRIIQEEFLDDPSVFLLSHSVTPDRDSVSVLKTYAQDKGVISKKWHLVTGDRQEIYKLGRRSYFVEEDLGIEKDIEEFLHTENFVLIDPSRHIRGIYNGLNKASINLLITDIKMLKEESKH